MLKLYYVPRTRSTRPRWLLEELGAPYEMVRLDPAKKENRTPEYLAIHPLGQVPALVDGDTKIFESAAICMYLADKFPEKRLAPAVGTKERGEYYQWMVFAMAELEPPIYTVFLHTSMLPEPRRMPALVEPAKEKAGEVLRALERHLANDRHFMVGTTFTAVDVVMGALLNWSRSMGMLDGLPNLQRYAAAMFDRPAAKRSREA